MTRQWQKITSFSLGPGSGLLCYHCMERERNGGYWRNVPGRTVLSHPSVSGLAMAFREEKT